MINEILTENYSEVVWPEFQLPGADHHIRIPDGEYRAELLGSECFFYRGSKTEPRIVLWFQVIDDIGPERRIARYYCVRKLMWNGFVIDPSDLNGKRPRKFQFDAGWKSDIVNDIARLRPDLFSPSDLPKQIPTFTGAVRILTKTIVNDSHGVARAESFQSSKVIRLLGIESSHSVSGGGSVKNISVSAPANDRDLYLDSDLNCDLYLDSYLDSDQYLYSDTDIHTYTHTHGLVDKREAENAEEEYLELGGEE
jgi:hypothetical protein